MWSLWITQPTQEGGTRLSYCAGTYDVAVVGAGHAGIEAALAAARLGMKTVLFTINLDAIGNMPCNLRSRSGPGSLRSEAVQG